MNVSITTMTSREFNQDTSGAKRAAQDGPVFITDRGKPAHVLLSFDEYQRLAGREVEGCNIVELLAMPEGQDMDFEIPRLPDNFLRPADL